MFVLCVGKKIRGGGLTHYELSTGVQSVCWQGDSGGVDLSLCLLAGRQWRGRPVSVGRETVEGSTYVCVCWQGLTCPCVSWQGDSGGVDLSLCLLAGSQWRG